MKQEYIESQAEGSEMHHEFDDEPSIELEGGGTGTCSGFSLVGL